MESTHVNYLRHKLKIWQEKIIQPKGSTISGSGIVKLMLQE